MCRNIKPLYNLQPPSSEAEIRDAALQFVRKVSGYRQPSRANTAAFDAAIDAIAAATTQLLASLQTTAAPRSRPAKATEMPGSLGHSADAAA
ncbi:MAG TPA: DUF2277 domain-containing protein [Promineifilum sp.]|nr:DUF2277 domain-containing protein [Promineifilum sp.]